MYGLSGPDASPRRSRILPAGRPNGTGTAGAANASRSISPAFLGRENRPDHLRNHSIAEDGIQVGIASAFLEAHAAGPCEGPGEGRTGKPRRTAVFENASAGEREAAGNDGDRRLSGHGSALAGAGAGRQRSKAHGAGNPLNPKFSVPGMCRTPPYPPSKGRVKPGSPPAKRRNSPRRGPSPANLNDARRRPGFPACRL